MIIQGNNDFVKLRRVGRVKMAHQVVQTDQAPAAIGPYSQAIRADRWLFLSGQIGLMPASGQFAGDGLVEQATQVLLNMRNVLEAAGYGLPDVVSVDVFLVDIAQFGSFNSLYQEFFGGHKPARAVVEVKGLPRGALVEVKCVAYKGCD
jgi:2-iminobutanoate/2-iminopropanoate deaminase